MKRIEQLFEQLGYNRENGLFYLNEADSWMHRFPYRISKVLKNIIQPDAFYSLHHHGGTLSDHPEPINNPIILFFDKPSDVKRAEIPKWSFCFGQAPVVIINTDDLGPVEIYHGYQFLSDHNYSLKNIDTTVDTFSLINLTLGKTWKSLYHQYFKDVPKVDRYLLNNIIDARRILVAQDGYQLQPRIANRLIGRLLFIRYMIDRHVDFTGQNWISGNDKFEKQASLNELILNKTNLYLFFDYLTQKYQGDLFPLKEENVDESTGEICLIYEEHTEVNENHLFVLHHLFSGSHFFKGGDHKGYMVQPSLFMVYDFEVIPVELISNIYENFIGKADENFINSLDDFNTKSKQYAIKAYYTPPFIVDYILSQTVTPYLEKSTVASCKVLDPACGSGIFLVEALRKIIEKEILVNGNDRNNISNTKLWKLLRENIFGIDIDEDAIEITIFSLYITLLDYKTPIEIEHFKFERLKNHNLFGGSNADFFNVEASFNELFTKKTKLNFILGNPPWGKVATSRYTSYIDTRRRQERTEYITGVKINSILHPELLLEIGNKEISQAFIVRASDFDFDGNLRVGLVVTGKSLYNSDSTSKNWRSYFLSNYIIEQVLELSGVNNKIVGGHQIFEEAKQAPAILFYHKAINEEQIAKNVTTHITVKPNRFFNYFRTIVIEKHDIKKVFQTKFLERLGGYDWLWKVLLHGNLLDFYFMLRLKSFDTIEKLIKENDLTTNGGLKIKDGTNKKSTISIKDYKFLDVESRKEFKRFDLHPSLTWAESVVEMRKTKPKKVDKKRNLIDYEGNVGYMPDPYYFRGQKLLVKKGLIADDNFKAVAAYSDINLAFTATVCAIKVKQGYKETSKTTELLKSLAGIINSKFFTYYILSTSSSAGIDRTRMDFDEIFSSPAVSSKKLAALVTSIQDLNQQLNQLLELDQEFLRIKQRLNTDLETLEALVAESFNITKTEQALIDYATQIALPILKRAEETKYGDFDIFKSLSIANPLDKNYLTRYAEVFIEHFRHRFNTPERSFFVHIHIAEDFIGFHFIVSSKDSYSETIQFLQTEDSKLFTEIGNLGIYSVTRDLYIQQDVRGFNKNTFYVIKPNEYKCWHSAVAHHDLLEFVDALARAETSNSKRSNV